MGVSTQTFEESVGDAGRLGILAQERLSVLPQRDGQREVVGGRPSEADLTLKAEIRKRILEAPNLGPNADNIKIITREGVVTLRGRVDSVRERDRLKDIAGGVPGVVRVEDDLDLNLQ